MNSELRMQNETGTALSHHSELARNLGEAALRTDSSLRAVALALNDKETAMHVCHAERVRLCAEVKHYPRHLVVEYL